MKIVNHSVTRNMLCGILRIVGVSFIWSAKFFMGKFKVSGAGLTF